MFSFFLFCFVFGFWDRVSLELWSLSWRPGWPRTPRDLPVSVSQELEFKGMHHRCQAIWFFPNTLEHHLKSYHADIVTNTPSSTVNGLWFGSFNCVYVLLCCIFCMWEYVRFADKILLSYISLCIDKLEYFSGLMFLMNRHERFYLQYLHILKYSD